LIHQNEAATEFIGNCSGGSRTCEEVQHQVTLCRTRLDDASEHTLWLLSRVARFLFARWRNNGVPPNIGWQLAQRNFFGGY